jgi:outer membrane protein assembly factor BamB
MPDPEAVQQDRWADVQPLLDQELSRLPDNYRAVIALCDLQGRTRKEVARQLGVPEGTVAGRLARARVMLAKRLAQRGVTLSGAALAAVLAQNLAAAGVPNSVVSSTIAAANLFAAGRAAGGAISARVATLTEGVLKAMLLNKLKKVATVLLLMTMILVGGALCAHQTPSGQPDRADDQNLGLPAKRQVVFEGAAISGPIPKERESSQPFVKWAAKAEFVANTPNNALVVKDRVIVGSVTGVLHAFRTRDGKALWTYPHGVRDGDRLSVIQELCSDGERVYFISLNGLTAVSVKDGTLVWGSELVCCDGPPLVLSKHGMVYVGGRDGNLYALDAKTGKQRWSSDFLTDAPPDRPNFPGARARWADSKARPSALASDGETLFLSVFDQSRVVAVSAQTGRRLWSFQADGWVYGAAVPTTTQVLFGSHDRNFYCLDKNTGKQVWKYATKGGIASGGVVDSTFVYFASCDGNAYCLRLTDGKERWRFTTDVGGQGHTRAIYSVPVLRRETLAFAAGEGQMYVLARDTGKEKGIIRPSEGSEMYCSPATDGTHLFLVTRRRNKDQGEASLVAIGFK